jgi:hypothetical protein
VDLQGSNPNPKRAVSVSSSEGDPYLMLPL